MYSYREKSAPKIKSLVSTAYLVTVEAMEVKEISQRKDVELGHSKFNDGCWDNIAVWAWAEHFLFKENKK